MIRLLLTGLAAIAIAAPSAYSADDNEPKAVIERAIKAHGGLDYLTKNQAGRSKNKGKITLPGVGEVEFTQEVSYMLPDKLKESMDLSVAGQRVTVTSVIVGDKFSIEANGQQVPANDQTKAAITQAKHMLRVGRMFPLLQDRGIELSAAGEIQVNEKPAIGVRVSAKDQKDINLYFDKKTHLLAKMEFRSVDPMTGKEVTEERFVMEYEKNAAGISMPKKVVVKHDGKDFIVADVQEATLLEKIDANEFSK